MPKVGILVRISETFAFRRLPGLQCRKGLLSTGIPFPFGAVLVRGRDVESAELAIQFKKDTCRWTLLGSAADVHRSDERARVLAVLAEAKEPLTPKEIMVATGRSDRNAVDQLLYRMVQAGDITKVTRGKYSLPVRLIRKKVRTRNQLISRRKLAILPILRILLGIRRR